MMRLRRLAFFAVLVPAIPFFAGCAKYEYDIVRPPELAQHVGTKAPVTFQTEEREYHLRTSDGRLVMVI